MDKTMVGDASHEIPEKLGSISVLDSGGTNAGPPIRTSARVHKKMRLDAAMASERKDSETKEDDTVSEVKDGKIGKVLEAKSSTKSSESCTVGPSTKLRRSSPSWSAEEQDIFFQALNEYGKDFEKIQSVFIAKAHEKDVPENLVKSKEQIRLFYLRTWHKLSKHLKFSPDVKRGVQELYALINYGEFRKSVGLLTKRSCVKLNELIHRGTCVKLNELIHHGHAHFRIRGKYVRVKTPQCPTLQKLNKLDVPECKEGKEELQLPPRVVVELRPRTIGDWCRVQSVAQNPRVRTLLPLDQRISSLLAFLQQRWRPPLLQHRDELLSSILLAKLQLDIRSDHAKEPAPLLHIAPPPNARITLHSFCLSEYLTSASLSLSAYRERLSSRESLPTLPRRMQVALSRSLNRSRLDTMKSNLSSESANHKKPCVLGKDVEAMVAAAAAATAAIEAKVKAAALAEQIEGSSLDSDLTDNKEMDVSTNPLTKSSLTAPYTECETNENDIPRSCTPESTLVQSAISGVEDCESGLQNKTFGNIVMDVQREKDSEKDSESEVQAEGESEFELEAEVDVPVDTEATAPQEVPAQISGETVSDNKLKTDGDAKVDTKSEVKIRAQIRKEKAAAKVEEIKQGWSLENAHAVTIGELYLMFGHEGKVELEYWWEERALLEEKQVVGNEGQTTTIASALQKLVSITKLNYKKPKIPCPCGYVCEETPSKTTKSKCAGKNTKETQEKPVAGCSNNQEKTVPVVTPSAPVSIPIPVPLPVAAAAPPRTIPHHMLFPTVQDGVFRRPLLAPMYRTNPRTANVEAIKAQLEKFRPKYCNRRGRAVRQKGVVVQRMLPLLPKVPDGHAMLALKVIPQTATKVAGEFVPIRPQPDGFPYSSPAATSTLHVHSNDPGVIRRQQLIRPNLLPSTSVNVAGNISALDCPENLQLSQIQQQDQIITVSIASSNCTDVQQQLSNDLGIVQQSTEEGSSSSKNGITQPSSLSAISSPPPSISHLLDLDSGSTVGDDISLSGVSCGLLDAALASTSGSSTSQNFTGLLSDETEAYPNSPPLVKLPDQQWLNSEVGDFSLGSLLGHLESPMKTSSQVISLSSEESSDVEAQLQCLMSENSVDYSAKFAVLAAQIAAAAAENKK